MIKMPYIKKELRQKFGDTVSYATNGNYIMVIHTILDVIKNMDDITLDGCLNYIFSQLLRKLECLEESEMIILFIINHVFLASPKYIKLERCLGLLSAMKVEFKRRQWRKDVLKVLDRLENQVIKFYGEYEDEKIKENGDLE